MIYPIKELDKKKIISFCVYGTAPMYNVGAFRNAELAKIIYPDWICRFYIFKECHHIKDELTKHSNVEVVLINKPGSHYSMLYRFLPLGEKNVSYFISRDTDSRLSVREKEAVVRWITFNKTFHIMKDHPLHHTDGFPILGGMWGAKGGIVPNIEELINTFIDKNENKHGMDQDFLYFVYHKLAKQDNITHTENTFPISRNIDRDKIWFVGQPIDENEQFHGPWKMFLDILGVSYEK